MAIQTVRALILTMTNALDLHQITEATYVLANIFHILHRRGVLCQYNNVFYCTPICTVLIEKQTNVQVQNLNVL